VNDGPSTDLDTWTTSLTSFQANWDEITFPSGLYDSLQRYEWEIRRQSDNALLTSGVVSGGTNPPESLSTSVTPSFSEDVNYYIRIRGAYYYAPLSGGPQWFYSSWVSSDGFLVDAEGPVANIDPLPAIQTGNSFIVSWSAVGAGAAIESYDVQSKKGSGTWQNWLTSVAVESATFTGNNGASYSFRVRAKDTLDRLGSYSSAVTTTINATEAALSLTASPSTLTFSSTETSQSVDLRITATATGSVAITSIQEERDYTSWGTETSPAESLSLIIPGGTTPTVSRTVTLSSLQRSKALGTGTVGGFSLDYTISGFSSGTPVEGRISIPVTVHAGLPSSLSVSSVSLALPPSPYYVGDVISNPTVTVHATGSGVVQGQVLVDGSLGWSSTPSFTVSVSGTTSFPVSGAMPTTTPGTHTVRVELTTPGGFSDDQSYTVSAATPPFPPSTLVLVPGVAELADLSGSAFVTSASGYEEYNFSGTATLRLPSLGGTELPGATVSGLEVRYEDSAPTVAQIRGGTVEKLAGGSEVLVTFADDTLRIKRVFFEGAASPAADHVLVDAMLFLPELGSTELLSVEDLVVGTGGVEDQELRWSPGDGTAFTAFGLEFKLHDVGTTPAFRFAEDSTHGHAYTLAGSLYMDEKVTVTPVQQQLTEFTGLRLFSDGAVEANLAFGSSYQVIPGILAFEEAEIIEDGGVLILALGGTIGNLPEPFLDLPATPYSLILDLAGDNQGPAEPITELVGGHSLDGSPDASEWDYSLATLDITYLGIDLVFNNGTFQKNQSSVLIGSDFYINCRNVSGGTVPANEDRRISYGEWSGGALTGGVELAMDGSSFWNPPDYPLDLETAFGDKKLQASSLTISIDNLLPVPDPFLFHCSGSIILVDVPGIDGDIDFDELHLGLNGSTHLPPEADTSGALSIMSVIDVSVEEVEWSESPTTISFSKDTTLDDGTNRSFQADETHTVSVDNYVRLSGATINFDLISSLSAGTFEELTVYEQSGAHNFVLKQAHIALSEVDLKADVEYVSSVLRLAGELKIPGPDGEIKAIAVGKIGVEAGQPTMGLFVAASNLSIAVAPGIFLDEIGGGLFINPVTRDIDDVKRLAKFERPDMGLDDKIMEKKPGGAGNPGGFALMFVGGFYVSSKDVFKGRALFVITQNYFSIDAEAEFGKGLIEAYAFMEIGWDPAYAEGYLEVEMDFIKILQGEGNLGFYAYASDTWGVFGEFNIEFLSMDIASGSMFIGPPGFMLETEVSVGVDIVIVSGYIKFGGMFWYNKAVSPATWGAYAMVEVHGELLKGLLSATARLEGALIGAPEFVIYAVGSVKFKVCWITVFEGSLWVSAGERGLDGGTGRNAKYDQLIEDARNMANQMNQAREDLLDALEQARLELAAMSDEQLEAAGLSLIERSGLGGAIAGIGFGILEEYRWQPGGLPTELAAIREMMFGSGQEALVARRNDLQSRANKIEDDLEALGILQEAVAARLEDYQDILLEDLPSVAELGSANNPLQMDTRVVEVGGETVTEIVDFSVNESQAQAQRDGLASIREEFAAYQESFIEQAGMIDARLQQLDEILFQDTDNLITLNQAYADNFFQMTRYLDEYLDFQDAAELTGNIMAGLMDLSTSENEVNTLMMDKAASLSTSELNDWVDDRIVLLNALVILGGMEEGYEAETDPTDPTYQIALFGVTGAQLWWRIPKQGFISMAAGAPAKKTYALQTFSDNARDFRVKWTQASQITDTYFERKSMLYDVLFEIYDQLATYGSGLIGITGEGNAAGFEGLIGSGLSFRTSGIAETLTGEGITIPPGSIPGKSKTLDPLFRPPSGGPGPAVPRPGSPGTKMPPDPLGIPLPRGGSLQPDGSTVPVESLPGDNLPGSQQGGGNLAFLLRQLELSFLAAGGKGGLGRSGTWSGTIVSGGTKGSISLDLSLDLETGGLPSKGSFDRDLSGLLPPADPVSWVPVTRYFEAKRAEITPYTEIPAVESFSGSVRSENANAAILSAAFSGSHPVGVVEYAYRIEPAGTEVSRVQGPPRRTLDLLPLPHLGQVSGIGPGVTAPLVTSGALSPSQAQAVTNHLQDLQALVPSTESLFQTQIPSAAMLVPIEIVVPWFSLGDREEILEPFFPDLHQEGSYYLYLRVRGAGGKTIVRRATMNLEYFDPSSDSAPVVSAIDATDDTAPTTPIVTTGGVYSSRQDLLYASWAADDPESGIQRFDYAVGTYTGEPSGAAPAAAKGTGLGEPLLGSTLEDVEGSFGKTITPVSVPTDILDWTSAGGRTEANLRGLSLDHGVEYVISVRAVNGVGLESVGSSDPILIDTTPPGQPTISSFQQVSADGYANSAAFSFQESQDPESGVLFYQVALGSSSELDNLLPWTEVTGLSGTVVNLQVLEGGTVYLQVKATNGAGLESTAVADITMLYGDGTPPPEASVTTDPALYLADGSKLTLNWAAVEDGESGVIGYEYGIGTSPATADVLSWVPVGSPRTPYLLGQGSSPGSGGEDNLEIELTDLSLSPGPSYYAVVKSINGSGLQSLGASEAFIVDSSPPVDTSLSAAESSSERDTLPVHLSARDSESGIAAYRFALWEVSSLSQADGHDDGELLYLPVGGFITGGQFTGTLEITGEVVTEDSYSGMITGDFAAGGATAEGMTPGSGSGPVLGMEGEYLEAPPWVGDLEMSVPPFFESEWSLITTGAPPESVDLDITISGFPPLSYNKVYRVKIWVKNGAGRASEAGSVMIEILRPRKLKGRGGTSLPKTDLPAPKSGSLPLDL